MSPSTSTLPHSAHSAAQNALQAALSDPTSKTGMEKTENGGTPTNEDDAQELDVPVVGGEESGITMPLIEPMRTVFEDQTTYNVKHPLYSSWTLWFDSAQTKGKGTGTPATPLAATPGIPPSTPLTAQAQNWMEDIKKVISLDSVEEFWGLYNNIVPPSQLPLKANYYLFKENIIPAWEDEANKYGGKWSIQLPRDKNRERVDKMWLYTMLEAIGETLDPVFSSYAASTPSAPSSPVTAAPQSLITGVIVSCRPQFFRLSIWTRLAPGSPSSPQTPHSSRALTSNGFSTHQTESLTPHPSEDGDALRERIEGIGRHFKIAVLGYAENAKLTAPLATEVEYVSHKDSEKKGKVKKIIV